MRKIILCLSLLFILLPVSAHDIWDAFDEKISISEYIDEYSELKPVQQFEKFKQDCKDVAIELTSNVYNLVYYEPKLLNVNEGYASYKISFRLEMKDGVKRVIEMLDTIKTSLPALNNSHLTPYDCQNLLSEGQYAEIRDNKMALAIIDDLTGRCKISTLDDENVYIQIAVTFKDKTYTSEGFINSVENEVNITVPVDCEPENFTATFRCLYGQLSFWDALIPQKTPPEGYKLYQGSLSVYMNDEYEKRKQR